MPANRPAKKQLRISPNLVVTKSSGLTEPFSEKKLAMSLIRCGAPARDAKKIGREIRTTSPAGIPTERVRKIVLAKVRDMEGAVAARYNLPRAIMKMGPSGFPFEKLIGRLYESEGYTVQINQTRVGKCANHEIDVVAKKGGKITFIECKFHNQPGFISDLKTSLYIKARSDDLNASDDERAHHESFALLTNTRFSSEGLSFGNCAGLELIGWTEPVGTGLARRLENSGLIPVTALYSLPHRASESLMQDGIITVLDLVNSPRAWRMVPRSPRILNAVQKEVAALLTPR